MADTRTNRQIMQSTDASARRTASAAQYSAVMQTIQVAQLAQSNALHEIAIKEQQETNDMLAGIESEVHGISQQLNNQSRLLEQQNESLQQLNEVASEISDKIDTQTQVIREGISIASHNAYIQWKQTDDGKRYTAWAKQARAWLAKVVPFQQALELAYHKDACNYAKRVLVEHKSEFEEQAIPYKLKPKEPKRVVIEPYKRTSKDIAIRVSQIAIILAVIYLYYRLWLWAFGVHWVYTNVYGYDFSTIRFSISMVIAYFACVGAYRVIKLVNGYTSRVQYNNRAYAQERRYQESLKQYHKDVVAYNEHLEETRRKYYQDIFPKRRIAMFNDAYHAFKSQPILWTTVDIDTFVSQITFIITNEEIRLPDVERLPELPEIHINKTVTAPREAFYVQEVLGKIQDSFNGNIQPELLHM